MTMIRPYRPSDCVPLSDLFHRAIHEIASGFYTREQLHAWSPEPPRPSVIAAWASDGRTFLVAEDETGLTAFGDLEANGHIDHLFCRPDRAGCGITARLYGSLEQFGRGNGIALLSSRPASRRVASSFVRGF